MQGKWHHATITIINEAMDSLPPTPTMTEPGRGREQGVGGCIMWWLGGVTCRVNGRGRERKRGIWSRVNGWGLYRMGR